MNRFKRSSDMPRTGGKKTAGGNKGSSMNLNRDLAINMARSPSFLGPVPASHNGLLHRLLEEVRIYHHAQHAASTPAGHREDVDVVISGGGMKGYFVTGAFAVLSGLQSVHVVRMSGASAGAWCAVFMACGLNPVDWADTYYMTRLCIRDGMSIADAYRKFARDILPADAYKRCSGVVHLSVSVVTWSGIKNLMVSEFTDNEDLIEGFGRKFRGLRVLDGGITDNTPLFRDGKRRQIVFQLTEVAYPFSMSLSSSDSCIEALILRGAIQMGRFLESGPGVIDGIRWADGFGVTLEPLTGINRSSSTSKDKGNSISKLKRLISAIVASGIAAISRLFRVLKGVAVVSKRTVILVWMKVMAALRMLVVPVLRWLHLRKPDGKVM